MVDTDEARAISEEMDSLLEALKDRQEVGDPVTLDELVELFSDPIINNTGEVLTHVEHVHGLAMMFGIMVLKAADGDGDGP
jgi:hypothetical protein